MTGSVFVNRLLNLKKIKYIGLDMDHTLIRYHSQHFESLVFQFVTRYLIENKNYPESIRSLPFHYEHAIRGSVVDSKHGNILKLSRYAAIRQSYHGTRAIDFHEQKKIYQSTYVDLNDPNYIAIDTSFSIAFCVLFGQLIDFKDQHPELLPSYETIAFDILYSVDKVHALGELKQYISQHLEEFVIREPQVVEGLLRFKKHGKTLFILTNSEYAYSKILLDYAITPYMPAGQTWQDLFDFVITLSNKPRFFYDNLKFLKISPQDGTMVNLQGPITPGIYQGGNAKKFTHDLGFNGDEILYIGDHIYGDILRLKKDCNWRTALIVEELGQEIAAQKKALPIEHEITKLMQMKTDLEQQYVVFVETNSPQSMDTNTLKRLSHDIAEIDKKLAHLLKEERAFFNPTWGRVFRAGAEESYFAYQVERYACIYMEKLVDLLDHSPLTYFRAYRRRLPHEPE